MERILCIDFGSTYTKVAVREDWSGDSELLGGLSEDPGFDYCFPSTVACVERKSGQKRWLIGTDAQKLTPDGRVRIYQNWKKELFSRGRLSSEYETVATAFFSGLLRIIEKEYEDLSGLPVRLTIPRLKNYEKAKRDLTSILGKMDVTLAESVAILPEPQANVYGLVTRGRNVAWNPENSVNLEPNYGQMFERDRGGLFEELRKSVKGLAEFHYTILVVDIGSFTCDFGSVTFNVVAGSIEDFVTPEIVQKSQPIGIAELDNSVLGKLDDEVREAIEAGSFHDWEDIKRRIYSGKPAGIKRPGRGRLSVGGGADAQMIEEEIEQYAKKVVRAVKSFCSVHGVVPGRAILTGGGTLISGIRERMVDSLSSKLNTMFYDLVDPDEPYRVFREKYNKQTRTWAYDEDEVEVRRVRNLELVRGGTAVGGCSVFIDLPVRLNET